MKRWWLRLLPYASPQKRGLTAIVLMTLVGILINVLMPWPLKLIVDYALKGQRVPDALVWVTALPGAGSPIGLVGWMAVATVLLFLASQAVIMTRNYIQAGVGNRIIYDLGAALFDHLQRLSLRFHGRQFTGDLVRRVTTDSSCAQELMISVFIPVFSSVVSLVVMFVVLCWLDSFLSLLALLIVPLIILLIKLFDRRMNEMTYQHQQLEGNMMATAEQTLSALPIVQAFGR